MFFSILLNYLNFQGMTSAFLRMGLWHIRAVSSWGSQASWASQVRIPRALKPAYLYQQIISRKYTIIFVQPQGQGLTPPAPDGQCPLFYLFFFYMRASLNSDRREEVHLYPKCLALSFSSRSLSSGETNCQHLINFALSYMAGLTLPAKRGTFVEFR